MGDDGLRAAYERYVDCLNRRDLDQLGEHVSEAVRRNGELLGLVGYRRMLEEDFERIPDLTFGFDLLAVDEDVVAARLVFDCSPVGELFGTRVDGQRVTFAEHVFYRYVDAKIVEVRSLLDADAVRAQVSGLGPGVS